jgi:hypothetical protein
MLTLYCYNPGQLHDYPIYSPVTYVESEAMTAASRALRRREAYELWRDGKLWARGGPATELTCPVRLRHV